MLRGVIVDSKISVIMSVYNEKEIWLKKAVDSVLAQTYKNFEFIIVLDNPGNTKLKTIIEEYKKKDNRIIFLINDINLGLARSLNKGIKISKGSYIARMDADDICTNDRFEKQLKYFNLNKNIDLLTTKAYFIDEKNKVIGKSTVFNNSEQLEKSLRYKNRLIHPTWMIKSSTIRNINGYNNVPYAEDYDLAYRLVLGGYKIDQINEFCLYYRIRLNGISRSRFYDGLKVSTFISDYYKCNQSYVSNEIENELMRVLSDKSSEKIFNIINTKIKNKYLKKALSLECKYYRKTVINSILCKAKVGI